MEQIYKFNTAKWNKERGTKYQGSFWVQGENCKIIKSNFTLNGEIPQDYEVGVVFGESDLDFLAKHFTKPASLKKFKFFLREIKVVPVIVEAATLDEAEKMVRDGDGEYLDKDMDYSDLCADDYFDNIFEKDAEVLTAAQ
jgi:5-methylthioribose kinase